MPSKLHNHFEHTVQLTREWVLDLCANSDIGDEQRAYRLLRVTLQTLRDWLSVEEATDLSAQLPQLLRGAYFEGWRPARSPVKPRHATDFVGRIENAFTSDPFEDTRAAVTDVFALLNRRISRGEIRDVRACLPRDLLELWQEP